MKKKLIRISTVPGSLDSFCNGQLQMLSEYFDVIAVSSPGELLKAIEKRERVRTIAVPMKRHISILKDVISLFRLICLFAKERPYIVHSMTPKAGLLAMMAAWLTHVPVRMHTFTGLLFPTSTGMMQTLLLMMDRLTCFCCTHINPEGQGVKRDLENFKVTMKPLRIIANGNVRGVRMDFYDRTPEVMNKALKIRDEQKVTFCFVGRLVGDKGINELVFAFTNLYEFNKNIRLLLVGALEEHLDPLLPKTMRQIKDHPAIEFVGNQNDVRPYLAASDIFVFPSYREGFPNVVLEAGALELPSIVTDINGCNEIILQGENGEIIPPRDEKRLYEKMKDWLEHPNKVKKMASNARQLVAKRYDQKIVWDALLQEYQRIIK